MTSPEFISIKDAEALIDKWGLGPITDQTLRNWCRNYKIGKKVVGRWKVDPTRLEKLLGRTNYTKE